MCILICFYYYSYIFFIHFILLSLYLSISLYISHYYYICIYNIFLLISQSVPRRMCLCRMGRAEGRRRMCSSISTPPSAHPLWASMRRRTWSLSLLCAVCPVHSAVPRVRSTTPSNSAVCTAQKDTHQLTQPRSTTHGTHSLPLSTLTSATTTLLLYTHPQIHKLINKQMST